MTDGPTLLAPSCGEPPAATAPEIARLDPNTVIALGGENAVCDDLLATLADGRATDRLAADDRFGTAAAIATRAFGDGADVVYVADAADSPDAVAGGALTDGPILLVPSDGQPPETVTATLERLDPGTVIALGGTNAVAEDTLAAVAGGRPTDRVAGPSRFDTAAAIAERAFPTTSDTTTAYLARGDVFADAVAPAPSPTAPSCWSAPAAPSPQPSPTTSPKLPSTPSSPSAAPKPSATKSSPTPPTSATTARHHHPTPPRHPNHRVPPPNHQAPRRHRAPTRSPARSSSTSSRGSTPIASTPGW